ncbi:MAG: hypothetical protein WCI97_09355 [Bacteroidota bacterium]
MATEKSANILGTSSNLLGFCLVVLTTFKISGFNVVSFIDEITGVISVFLGLSCLFSFLSMYASKEKLSMRYENFAIKVFIFSLTLLLITVVMIAFSIFL